ncbi:MAG: hypothetical protein LC776_03690 [Acidobacteria bacterium]|nr:hypothetical protein [Acidobacteriota bacterium]
MLTISRQVFTQWRDRSTRGLLRWLFAGQIAASSGFVVWMLANWVFVVTNMLMLNRTRPVDLPREQAPRRDRQVGKAPKNWIPAAAAPAKRPQSSRRQLSRVQPIMPSSSKYLPRAARERHHGLRGSS